MRTPTLTKAELNLMEGSDAYMLAKSLVGEDRLGEAADAFWKAILTWKAGARYSIEEAYQQFMHTFVAREIPEQGALYVAKAYLERKEINAGIQHLHTSLKTKESAMAYLLLAENDKHSDEKVKSHRLLRAFELASEDPSVYVPLGSTFFAIKEYRLAQLSFERACENDATRTDAFANAVYLRCNVCAWGNNGSQYHEDMARLAAIVTKETTTSMVRLTRTLTLTLTLTLTMTSMMQLLNQIRSGSVVHPLNFPLSFRVRVRVRVSVVHPMNFPLSYSLTSQLF